MAKYDPLEMHLLCLPADQSELTLSFDEVESIIADGLPRSAYLQRDWWSNARARHRTKSRAWRDVGWLVQEVDQGEGWVRFVRQ